MSNEIEEGPLLENASVSSEEISELPSPGSYPTTASSQRTAPQVPEASLSHENGSQPADFGTSEQRVSKTLQPSAEPAADRPPSLIDYDIMNGVPVRILKADKSFSLHTFSEDGELFAVGGFMEGIKVWRRTDYALVATKPDMNLSTVMTFIDGKSDVLRVAEYSHDGGHSIIDLRVRRSDKESDSTSECLVDNLEVIRRSVLLASSQFPHAKFSDDGNILMLRSFEQPIKIYNLQNATPLPQGLVSFKEIELPYPGSLDVTYLFSDMSPNGHHVWSYYYYYPMDDYYDEEDGIAVWPRLHADGDDFPDGVVLRGRRAVWTASGDYLAVWQEEGEEPRLSVYETENLFLSNLEPIATKILRPGLDSWQAFGRKWSDCSLLIRETCKSGKERYIDWNFKNDVVIDEVFIDRKTEARTAYEWNDLDNSTEDLYPSCDEDGHDWIGSMAVDQSFAIISRCSGTTVFNITPPEDMKIKWHCTTIRFDRHRRHFLIIGEENILAFMPASFLQQDCWQYSTVQFPDNALWYGDTWKPFARLGSCALAASGQSTAVWSEFRMNPHYYDSNEKLVLSSSGYWCVCIKDSEDGSFHEYPEVDKKYVACIIHSNKQAVDVIQTADRAQFIFLLPRRFYGCDHVMLVNIHGSPKLLTFDMDRHGTKTNEMNVSLDIEQCLHICQTRDRTNLLILERRAVCIFNLKTMSVQEKVPYQMDFEEVVKRLVDDSDSCGWWTRRMNSRQISDDGQIVLLGWDMRRQRSILVTPKTKQQKAEKAIDKAGERISPFCQLTDDGRNTLFSDVDELSNGRIVIGIYSNKDFKMHTKACYAEGILDPIGDRLDFPPNQNGDKLKFFESIRLYYELSDDASELLALIVPNNFLTDYCDIHFKKEIKRYSIYGTERCIPDYASCLRSISGTKMEKVQWLFDTFGSGTAFNHPISGASSIFQEAFLKGDQTMTENIVELAHREGFEIANRCADKDLLTESVNRSVVQRVEEAINLKTSTQCPIKERALITAKDLSDSMRLASHRVIKALQEDEFVIEMCHIDVHADFLDPVIRRDRGIHIDTSDEVLNWKLDDDLEILAQKWAKDHSEIVDEMEKDGNQSRAAASVKIVSIDGAARPGQLGLIRHLLLRGVPEEIFKSKAVKWIVSWKWFKIWKPKFIQKGLWHLAFLACLTTYTILLGTSCNLVGEDISIRASTTVLVFILALYGLWMTMDEKRELTSLMNEGRTTHQGKWNGVRYYFRSKWNWVDTASCLIVVILMPLLHVLSLFISQCNPVLSAMVAVEVLFSYIKVWYYVQPFRVTGALVLMIENIIRDCLPFLGLLSIMLLGFVSAIHVMLRHIAQKSQQASEQAPSVESTDDRERYNEDAAEAYGTFPKSILTLFCALFGEFDPAVYTAEHDLMWLVLIVFSMYMITQIIVLLNLLISIMGDTFDRVKSNEEGQMLMARGMIIDSCEASATKEEMEEIEKMTGRYICALESTNEQSEDTAPGWWTGKFNMLVEKLRAIVMKSKDHTESIVKEEVKAFTDEVKEDVKDLRDHMDVTVKEEVKILREEMKEDLNTTTQRQEQRIAAIESQLHALATEQASAISGLASAIADAKTQTEQHTQDLSTKIERILSLLDPQAGT